MYETRYWTYRKRDFDRYSRYTVTPLHQPEGMTMTDSKEMARAITLDLCDVVELAAAITAGVDS